MLAHHLESGPRIVLDVGCGRGRLPRSWRTHGPGRSDVSFVGIDVLQSRLAICQGVYEGVAGVDVRDLWPFADASFDAVVCEQVIEHFKDGEVEWILSEIARVLKPGGLALIGTPVFSRLLVPLAPLALSLRNAMWPKEEQHSQHWSLHELQGRISAAGLGPVEARGYRMFSLLADGLEDFRWYYQLHSWLGRRFPGWCVEATVCARRGFSVS